MKNFQFTMAFVLPIVLLVVGCKNKTRRQVIVQQSADKEETADSTVYGILGDATSMNSMQVITDKGDTLTYMINTDGDIISNVQGGEMVGDRVAVIGTKLNDELVAQKVINLTTLLGKWVSIDKNFDIQEGGVVKSFVKAETSPWTSWKIINGKLLLNKDTFVVNTLGPDSLYLENKNGIFAYKRQTE